MLETRNTPTTTLVALQAVLTHAYTHDLGAPFHLDAPPLGERTIGISVASATLPGWLASGFTPLAEESFPLAGRIAGQRHERVLLTGDLDTAVGTLRVSISAVRRVAELQAVTA